MPIPWLAVLQAVPWSDVLNNAPKVADGAKKLWKSIGKKSSAPKTDVAAGESAYSSEAQTIATLHARLLKMEAAQIELHDQMLASSELIKALAEQNTLLIGRAELMRLKIRRMIVALAVVGIIAAYALAMVLSR
jgi:hypothetical protein